MKEFRETEDESMVAKTCETSGRIKRGFEDKKQEISVHYDTRESIPNKNRKVNNRRAFTKLSQNDKKVTNSKATSKISSNAAKLLIGCNNRGIDSHQRMTSSSQIQHARNTQQITNRGGKSGLYYIHLFQY